MTSERELDAVPALGPLYRRAAMSAVARRSGSSVAALPDTRLVVRDVAQDVADLAAYDRVCGFGLRDQVPATWLHVLTFPLQVRLMAEPSFPFPLLGMVHVHNTITVHRPVMITDVVTLRVHADRLAPHRRGATVDLVGTVEVDGELAWEGRSTYLVRGAQAPATPPLVEPVETGSRPPTTPSAIWSLPGDLGRRYAAVSGDVNPIHVNPLAAKAFGFPRAIAHGMWTCARALASIEPRLPEAYGVTVAFRKPLLVPGSASFAVAPDSAGWRFAVRNRAGDADHMVGSVTVR